MTFEHIIDPTAPTCERCGAKVHDPCTTDEKQRGCELPDFCFPNRMGEAGFQQPKSEETSRAYQNGWDDCLMRIYQVLGEKFTLPAALPSARDEATLNKLSRS